MKQNFVIVFVFLMTLSCQKTEVSKIETNSPIPTKTITAKHEAEMPKASLPVEVANLVNKSVDEFDKIFGKPLEIKPNEDGAEFRLYQIANQPKGLAVRFYGGKAKSFNLIVSKPAPTSKEALKQFFNLDVGKTAPIKDPKEPLTEKYQGIFNGVKFSKVSAKKEGKDTGFIFVLAETKD